MTNDRQKRKKAKENPNRAEILVRIWYKELMSQLINFKDFSLPDAVKYNAAVEYRGNDATTAGQKIEVDDEFKLTLNILVHNNPNKTNFTIKETAAQLNVSEEFIRRRIKSNHIKATYFGDKPMVHITELARISLKGL